MGSHRELFWTQYDFLLPVMFRNLNAFVTCWSQQPYSSSKHIKRQHRNSKPPLEAGEISLKKSRQRHTRRQSSASDEGEETAESSFSEKGSEVLTYHMVNASQKFCAIVKKSRNKLACVNGNRYLCVSTCLDAALLLYWCLLRLQVEVSFDADETSVLQNMLQERCEMCKTSSNNNKVKTYSFKRDRKNWDNLFK